MKSIRNIKLIQKKCEVIARKCEAIKQLDLMSTYGDDYKIQLNNYKDECVFILKDYDSSQSAECKITIALNKAEINQLIATLQSAKEGM